MHRDEQPFQNSSTFLVLTCCVREKGSISSLGLPVPLDFAAQVKDYIVAGSLVTGTALVLMVTLGYASIRLLRF